MQNMRTLIKELAGELVASSILFTLFFTSLALPNRVKSEVPILATSKEQLESELSLLRQATLKKVSNDTDMISEGFANSENIFRSLRVAYSFKTVLDSVNNAFSLFGVPGTLRDFASAKNITEASANSALAVGSIMLIWENMQENAGKLELVFNSGRYVETTRRMLKDSAATQPLIGFDTKLYTEGVKFQIETGAGQESVLVKRQAVKDPCETIKPRGSSPAPGKFFRGVNETRSYLRDLFQQVGTKIKNKNLSEADSTVLLGAAKNLKGAILNASLGKSEVLLTLPKTNGCSPSQTQITLGRVGALNRVLASSYSALNDGLLIERKTTLKTMSDTMLSASTFYFKQGSVTRDIAETAGKVSLASDIGGLINKQFTKQVDPGELIGSLPQEMLMSYPAELSETILAMETFSGFVDLFLKAKVGQVSSSSTPETPTIFLLDISGSMLEDNKIEAAKESGLNALREIGENRKKKQDNSTVAISTFGGECDPRSVKQILSYTPNLSQAENIFRSRIPKPDGATPLYTAIDLTVDQMLAYLSARPNLREGRILLLSDGQNTCGDQVRPRGVYSQSSRVVYQQVRFLTIGFSIQAGSQAERDLQYLASASNGKYYPARDSEQLSRVFEKAVCVYIPKQSAGAGGADFQRGMDAIASRNFEEAIRIFTIYVRANPSDPAGYYNLALACEAAERYRQAVENYLKCLQFALDASEKTEIEERIEQLEEDAFDEKEYYLDLLRSDLDYLTRLHSRLFELKNAELAAEFAGFVAEKGGFYRSIPQILEVRDVGIDRNCGELGDSLDYLNRRVGMESFDRDAVSLLAPPIGYLRELIRRIEGHNITIRR